ncbi:hypothetical protein [Nannocystis bainbridge]|uniref:Uncharacterized protein n=1 Tax=Nannocystis bainbridge TaxID=2995303 RepID=A0ABT5EAD2_9BACT|nr:hypothetical protein [Nannocystis bainbridge]MDC0721741.1 hypothetical protein [Nannocystis bainbridge]
MDAPIDLRPVFRAHWPSYGPDWDEAIELGIDVAALERNLALTPEQRILQKHRTQQAIALLRAGLSRARHA